MNETLTYVFEEKDCTLRKLWNSNAKIMFSFTKEEGIDPTIVRAVSLLPDLGTIQIQPEGADYIISLKAPMDQKKKESFGARIQKTAEHVKSNCVFITASHAKKNPTRGFSRERED